MPCGITSGILYKNKDTYSYASSYIIAHIKKNIGRVTAIVKISIRIPLPDIFVFLIFM